MKSIKALIFTLLIASSSISIANAAGVEGAWPGDDEPGTIVIITSDRTLHYISDYGRRVSYPIAVGREGTQWFGETYVTGKRANPEWRPTPNMRRKHPNLPRVVKGGPNNPLGAMAIYLAQGYLRIHGTNEPSSIGKSASSGCFRMYNEDIKELAKMIDVTQKNRVLVLP